MRDFVRRERWGALFVVALMTGAFVVATSGPAEAQTVTRTFTAVHCTAVVNGSTISQDEDVTVSITAPDQVTPGQVFTITFPGGTSELPSSSNGLTISEYKDLSLSFQIRSSTFKSGSIVNPGFATINGDQTPETATLLTTHSIAMGQPGPFPPGTLVTPDISVQATAGAVGSSITLNALKLTTTVVFNGGLTANVTCNIPQDTIITIPVGAANTPPSVNAGPDVSGNVGASIALSGSVSDPDSTPTDAWTINDPACSFANPAAASTSVLCTKPGTFTATLTANDGSNAPVSDSAQVTVIQTTSLVVNAGGPVSGAVSHPITLRGSVSDPSGTPSISWTVNSPNCTFANASSATTTISCSAIGSYVATLTAHDGADSQASTAAVTVDPDIPPTVDAGPDAAGNTATPITLTGSVSDPDDTPSIHWSASDPHCSFADPTRAVTTINCSVQGNYTATLTANDGFNPAISDTVPVTVTDILFPFNYDVDATTHLKTLNQDVAVPTGTFSGVIDITTGVLQGDIALPPAEFTFALAGVGLVTADMQIAETQHVAGTLDVSTFAVSATAVFDINITSLHPTATPTVNLVGNSCKTSTPVSVTMNGTANLTGSSTFSGTYTIPPLANCGLLTTALNAVIAGPGNTFTATAYPPPVPASVTTQPTDTTVAPGQTYSFTAEGAGTPDPTVQWQVSTNGGSTFTDISGATDGTYSATAALSDSGEKFRAVFTNPSGTATSDAATLTVAVAPDAPTIGSATAAPLGANVSFTPPAHDGGSPILDYTADCTSGNGGTEGSSTGDSSPVTVTGLTGGATYTCTVTARNTIGSSVPSGASNPVVPTAPPTITAQPADTTVLAGATYSFSATATGTPAPTAQWQVSSDGGSTYQDIAGATGDSLTGTAALGDSGKRFRADFTNSVGTAATTGALLTVQDPNTISIAGSSVVEGNSGGNRTATLEVTLSQPAGQTVTVHYATADGTATAGSAYVAKHGLLTFKPGKTRVHVTVAVKPDTVAESDEIFQVVLSSPAGGDSLAPNQSVAEVTILDDDSGSGLQVSVGDATICRSRSGPVEVVEVLVSLSAPAPSNVTVLVTLSAGSAASGTDFKPWKPKTLTFLAGHFQKVIAVSVIPGTSAGAKTALLTLSNPSSGLSIGRTVGTLTIVDHA